MAAVKLAGLTDRLPKLVHDGNVGGPPGPSHFLAMLLGSVVGDNYIRGRAFQEELNARLNLPENTQSYTIEIRTKTGALRTQETGALRFGDLAFVVTSRPASSSTVDRANSGTGPARRAACRGCGARAGRRPLRTGGA